MKTKLLLVFSIAAIVGVFIGGTSRSGGTPQKNSNEALSFSNLTLEVGSTKDEFVPLEPIPLLFKLENATTSRVWGHTALELSENHIELFVIALGGSVKKIEIAKPVAILVEVGRSVFQPGESHRSKDLLTIGMNDVLSQPGDYQIQAVVHGANWSEEVKSNLLLVHITEPNGANRRALNLIRSESSLPNKFAGYPLSEFPQALAILKTLSNDFSETVYSDYASYRVGEFYFYTKKYDKAKEYLDKLADKNDFIFAKEVSDHLNKLKGVSSQKVSQSH